MERCDDQKLTIGTSGTRAGSGVEAGVGFSVGVADGVTDGVAEGVTEGVVVAAAVGEGSTVACGSDVQHAPTSAPMTTVAPTKASHGERRRGALGKVAEG